MAITARAEKDAKQQIRRDRSILTQELENMQGGAKWLTTLILAEMAGIVTYRGLGDGNTLSLGFGLAIGLLGFALAVLVVTVLMVRRARTAMASGVFAFRTRLLEHSADINIPPVQGDKQVQEELSLVLKAFQRKVARTGFLEVVGLCCFGLGSLWAICTLFWLELLALFHKAIGQ
jgi:hypothetical protein